MARLIIDENLNKRLASTLKRRGRDALSVSEVGYKGLKDPELVAAIARDHPGAVLVTGDDNMPAAHADILRSTGIAVATVDPARPAEFTREQWTWEVVERWAHRMAEQKPGSWRRYGRGARDWKPPRRVRKPQESSSADTAPSPGSESGSPAESANRQRVDGGGGHPEDRLGSGQVLARQQHGTDRAPP